MVILAQQKGKDGKDGFDLVCPTYALPKSTLRTLKAIAARQKFTGAMEKTLVIPSPVGLKASKLIIFGIGDADTELKLGTPGAEARIEGLGAKIAAEAHAARGELHNVHFVAPNLITQSAHLIAGIVLRSYNFSLKKEPKPSPRLMISHQIAELADAYKNLEPTLIAVYRARRMVDLPPNLMGTQEMLTEARRHGDGIELVEFDKSELTKLNMGGMLAVARGAKDVNPPYMVVMKHQSIRNGAPTLALIGKGVVYDTGGLAIKPLDGMLEMKIDMGGAAAVFGAMDLISRMKLPFHVVGIAGLVENSISEASYRNGDVITMKSGKTVLVNNTDAEGRMVLADCAAYAEQDLHADAIVSIATLTGAAMIALNDQMAAGFSDSDAFYAAIDAASKSSGDTVWRMPLHPSFDKLLDGDQADMKNSGGRMGGASIGAHFVKRHISDKTVFAHFDIAGPVEAQKGPWHVHPKGATGFGVRLLADMVAQLANNTAVLTRVK